LLPVFCSFLGPRTQKVMINVECSDSDDISIGSPHLSPLLLACFNCRFHLYADDLQIYIVDEGKYVNQLVALVNGDLQRILD
jgi:hypothetical protein